VKPLLLLPALLLAGCGGDPAPPEQNEASRLTDQITRQANQLTSEADNGAAAVEQALENEGAVIFENRGNLLNETGSNAAAQPR
jgi:hypothetical protein